MLLKRKTTWKTQKKERKSKKQNKTREYFKRWMIQIICIAFAIRTETDGITGMIGCIGNTISPKSWFRCGSTDEIVAILTTCSVLPLFETPSGPCVWYVHAHTSHPLLAIIAFLCVGFTSFPLFIYCLLLFFGCLLAQFWVATLSKLWVWVARLSKKEMPMYEHTACTVMSTRAPSTTYANRLKIFAIERWSLYFQTTLANNYSIHRAEPPPLVDKFSNDFILIKLSVFVSLSRDKRN